MPEGLKERGEALNVLKQFETAEGKLRVPELMKEVFIQTYAVQKKLEAGAMRFDAMDEKMDRCPVLDGTATWEGIHLPPSPPLPTEPELPPDQVRLSGRIRTRTIITLILVIVLASTGGAALAWVTKLGGI